MALSGIIGCGKTTMLNHLQTQLVETGDILVAKSLSVDKERVTLSTLLLTLFLRPLHGAGLCDPDPTRKARARAAGSHAQVQEARRPIR